MVLNLVVQQTPEVRARAPPGARARARPRRAANLGTSSSHPASCSRLKLRLPLAIPVYVSSSVRMVSDCLKVDRCCVSFVATPHRPTLVAFYTTPTHSSSYKLLSLIYLAPATRLHKQTPPKKALESKVAMKAG